MVTYTENFFCKSSLTLTWICGVESQLFHVYCNVPFITTDWFLSLIVVVNMILINMMMAIINLSFEEINSNGEQYKNKFELMEYVGRTTKEMIGTQIAEPIEPIYLVLFTSKFVQFIQNIFKMV